MKRMKNNDEAVSPVIAIILMVAITVVLAGVLYMWVMSMVDPTDEPTIMAFEARDGVNKDVEHGCFFTIRARQSVDIDPSTYFFYVAETGQSPKALDFGFRDYEDQGGDELTPVGGDRNKSYRFDDKNWKAEGMKVETTGQMWSDGEYIGFDMPMASMGMDIVQGREYEVMIKDSNMQVVFEGDFIYQEQAST